MSLIYKIGIAVVLMLLSRPGFASQCDSDSQLAQVQSYFNAIDKIFRSGSTVEDIDNFLSLTHEKVQYVHTEYSANFNKKTWREAFLRQLNKGSYQNKEDNQARILNSIIGKNHAAIEYSYGMIQKDGSWKSGTAYFALFGFTDGKISLIKEYW
ncbi:nuclear transport factor 2-like protein [Shewanella violacea]|uniref:SnoaL-like domain-containing protein n=1 Tax=Shewanella violacea (strain JCM 10179 / CIP 106290 / LMG 19151 / DSS12) TaxID=637905 RepID=D4ZB41_SHEVD|nr:hypothetical protein [Shewanella violacea]BAJ03236.1 hypothetical protein SVI_3265 [Shewanella violacea DSS12]